VQDSQNVPPIRRARWPSMGRTPGASQGATGRFARARQRRVFKVYALLGEVHMTEAEVQARAILAGALIQSGSIDVNNTNLATDWRLQPNTERLHHLVELLYRAITETRE
jgi:hypothetical protein